MRIKVKIKIGSQETHFSAICVLIWVELNNEVALGRSLIATFVREITCIIATPQAGPHRYCPEVAIKIIDSSGQGLIQWIAPLICVIGNNVRDGNEINAVDIIFSETRLGRGPG